MENSFDVIYKLMGKLMCYLHVCYPDFQLFKQSKFAGYPLLSAHRYIPCFARAQGALSPSPHRFD